MNRGRIAAAVVGLLAILQAGCLVEIHHGGDVEATFRTARAEAERDRDRRGPAHRLNVLVFDPEDGSVVRVSMPMWLARKLEGHIHWGDEDGERGDRLGRRLAKRVRIEDLAAAGPGLIADVEDDDGGQVLVWLR